MVQRLTRDVGVDQGSRDAELPKPHPAAEILRPILHQERDDISSTQAQLKGPVCDLVGFFVYFSVRHAPIFEQHERVITVCGRFFLQHVCHRVSRIGLMAQHARHTSGDLGD